MRISDWSSDVCSSDLVLQNRVAQRLPIGHGRNLDAVLGEQLTNLGGPIVGPGAATVLIGKLPAAVMGDSCVCVGPPDTIIKGSSTVMICGKPASPRLASYDGDTGFPLRAIQRDGNFRRPAWD